MTNINDILTKHAAWLRDEPDGERADLSRADLRRADLRRADLSRADLSRADLREADLRRADLREADLREADLREADLSRADLREADLSRADLSRAIGNFAIGSFGRHLAIATGGYICIGCERHTYAEWLAAGAAIGAANDYTQAEIDRYMAWINLAITWLSAIEPQESATRAGEKHQETP